MKKFMILALCAWTFFACGNGKKNETTATTQPAKPRFDNPYFASWVNDGETGKLEMIIGGQTYNIKNFQVFTSATYSFEAHAASDSTEIWILQGRMKAGTSSELDFNGTRLGENEEKADGWYFLYGREGLINLGDKPNLSVIFRRTIN